MGPDFTAYKLLSFDIYGTLIDWDSGVNDLLQNLVSQLPQGHSHMGTSHQETCQIMLRTFSAHERALQMEQPSLPFNKLLTETYKRLAKELELQVIDSDAQTFGESVGSYPAFPDTISAMQTLGKHYHLVALSNVDNDNFSRTLSGPLAGVKFSAIYTAENIGSYKPSLDNFRYLIEHVEKDLGVKKTEILHTAHSLTHDHVPAKEIGLAPGVWIARADGDGKNSATEKLEKEEKIKLGAIYTTLGEMAEDVERAFRSKG